MYNIPSGTWDISLFYWAGSWRWKWNGAVLLKLRLQLERHNSANTLSSLSESSQWRHVILYIHLAVYKILNVENVADIRLAELHGKTAARTFKSQKSRPTLIWLIIKRKQINIFWLEAAFLRSTAGALVPKCSIGQKRKCEKGRKGKGTMWKTRSFVTLYVRVCAMLYTCGPGFFYVCLNCDLCRGLWPRRAATISPVQWHDLTKFESVFYWKTSVCFCCFLRYAMMKE